MQLILLITLKNNYKRFGSMKCLPYLCTIKLKQLNIMSGQNKVYSYEDMLSAFEAGSAFQENDMKVDLGLYEEGEEGEMTEPDFDVWIEEYNNKQ